MRFMMLMIPGVYQGGKELPADFAPDVEAVEAMTKYNEELAKAGALLKAEGLTPLSMGFQVSYAAGKATVTDGPYAEAKEVVGGYWIINVASREEAIDWAKRIPAGEDDIVEVRQIFEMEDFPEDVQRAADNAAVKAAVAAGGS